MPNFGDWIHNISSSASSSTWGFTSFSAAQTHAQVLWEYEEYQIECERQDQVYELQMQMHEQQIEEERQLIKDKKKYPLFFWRETCVKHT